VAGRSQDTPAELNQPVTVIVDDPLVPWTKLRLTLIEVVTGTPAWQMALAWSPGNPGPPAGFEYIMGRFRIEVLSQTNQGSPYQESLANFESVSGTGTVHPGTGVCCNDPSPGQAGFTGAVWEGWADFLSETSDPLPKAVYRRGEASEAWFELKPSP
jgi:hypothetical protein